MSVSPALAAGLAAATALLLGGYLWYDYQRHGGRVDVDSGARSVRHPIPAPSQAPPTRTDSPARRSDPKPALYRCDGPDGVSYQDSPCTGRQVSMKLDGGTVSVVQPQPGARIVPRKTPMGRAPATVVAGSSRRRAQPAARPAKENTCDALKAQIRNIEAQERAGGTAQWMDHLRASKRSVQERMWRIGC